MTIQYPDSVDVITDHANVRDKFDDDAAPLLYAPLSRSLVIAQGQ